MGVALGVSVSDGVGLCFAVASGGFATVGKGN